MINFMANLGGWELGEVHDLPAFMELLRQLKKDSGLSYRQLEERAADVGDVLPRSTASSMLSRDVAPRPDQLAAFVKACGEGERVAQWLQARDRIAGQQVSEACKAEPARRGPLVRPLRRGTALSVLVAVPVLTAVGVWMLAASGEPTGDAGADRSVGSASPGVRSALLSGWVHIRPVTAPDLCLTDGRVLDRRYTPLVAVQRRCSKVAPQATKLEPMGGDTYRIQWHHPDYGKGCLKALDEGAGAGLLEPYDDCAQASRFHLEPSGPYAGGRYVLRVAGQGCVGIKASDTSEGTEAVMERCVGKGGQVFFIEPAS
ncbi:RICIN domain-containing protein [Streptomyces sp. 8N616]|uniref:RICIN domain-containing protein n=1 Tax=Streptomyces sp. 8N616 TaxID=3457414 RepID=UPI003FD65576